MMRARAHDKEPRSRRILVALDNVSAAAGALAPVVLLARHLEADLLGLFVENPDLTRLAEHTRSFILSTIGQSRHDDSVLLRRVLRARLETTRRTFEDVGRRARIKTEFRISQGQVEDAVLGVAESDDTIFFGVGCVRPMAAGVVVVFDGSEGGHRAVDIAAGLAWQDRRVLTVVLVTGRPVDARQWEAELRSRLGTHGTMECVTVPGCVLADVTDLARRRKASLMVMDRQSGMLRRGGGLDLLGLPVLLVS